MFLRGITPPSGCGSRIRQRWPEYRKHRGSGGCPQGRDGDRPESVTERQCVRAGVHDDAGPEALTASAAQGAQAVEVACTDGSGELGLDAGDRAVAGLDPQIALASSGGAQVVETNIRL